MYLNLGVGLGGIRRESKLYAGHSTSALPLMTLMTWMKLGERNNIHRCVAHHAILYFPLAILINYSANLNIYVEEQSLAKYTQNSLNVFWEIQGGATCHTTAEIRAFFNA